MRVVVTTEARFDRTPDGACWIVGWAAYEFWTRYLDVFDEASVLARVRDVARPPRQAVRVDGPQVSVMPLAYYLGPWAYLRQYPALRQATRRAIGDDDAVIVRAPGATTGLVIDAISRRGAPFGVEVVGDPEETFASGGVRTVLRPLLRRAMTRDLRAQCARACAVAYVTSGSLQKLYPPGRAAHVTSYSSIVLPDEAFVRAPRVPRPHGRRIVFVGSLEQLYKGPDVLIDAAALIRQAGYDVDVAVIGEGKYRQALEARAAARGLGGAIRFLGQLSPGEPIRRELDAADVFVLPSRTEGLPRALIEAMARGLPCVASDVGGIPELLRAPERVPPGDAAALAATLAGVMSAPERLERLSAENLRKARDYHQAALRPRRQAFYRAVREATEERCR